MNPRLTTCLLSLITALGGSPVAAGDQSAWRTVSPDGRVSIVVHLDAPGEEPEAPVTRPSLHYRVECDGVEILAPSPLGIVCRDRVFTTSLALVSATEPVERDSDYVLLHGKRRACSDHHRERVLTFESPERERLELIVRAYDDGVAFRYRFPGDAKGPFTVTEELTGFHVPPDAEVWAHPYDHSTKYSPAYETYYEVAVPAGTESPHEEGWAFPLLFQLKSGKGWGLLTEAGLDASYCGTRLAAEVSGGVYRLRFPGAAEGYGFGPIEPASSLPWATPWRVVMAATEVSTIVESTLVTDVSPPSRVEDTSWIRPGRASWSWLYDHDSPQDYDKLRRWVDLAAEMGWEYSLVDANWTIMKNGTIHDLLAYAKERGVKLLLWYNSGGPHNHVSEKPRGLMFHRDIRREEFERLRKWGVAGVKVDFFQSDKQNIIGLYLDILEDAAEFEIMVNFHGCTLPRGWSRTYPHLMTMEAVRGEECYSFDRSFPEKAPVHNTTIPFTRNVVGPMDYTPVMFKDNVYPRRTTAAHELALAVVFESGWLHFADGPDVYRSLADEPKEFLREVPVAWDETRCVAGEPGRYVVIARRSGSDWYVAGINGRDSELSLDLDLSFIGEGGYSLVRFDDGAAEESEIAIRTTKKRVEKPEALPVRMEPHGGFTAVLRPAGARS